MSLYGTVAKVGSSSFQFDRVYSSRKAMDDAVKNKSDGVYAGRYILIEYGERYTKTPGPGDSLAYETEETHEPVYEKLAFKTSVEDDLSTYGTVYDSTVWQKIFATQLEGAQAEKYIMVAELNGHTPPINATLDMPLTYKTAPENSEGILAVKFLEGENNFQLVKITNAEEIYNAPHFDRIFDTELGYKLHLPTNIELGINNSTINYNEKGFNQVYGYKKDEGYSGIAWIPEGLEYDITYTDNTSTINPDGSINAHLRGNQDIDKKTLYMNLPALGNVMSDLYDVLYGKPNASDLDHGGMRPYFAKYIQGMELVRPVIVNGEPFQENGVYLQVQGELDTDILISPTYVNNEVSYSPGPNDGVTIVYWNGDPNEDVSPTKEGKDDNWIAYYYIQTNPNSWTPNDILKVHIPKYPTGDDDDLSWLSTLAQDDDLLKNNSGGLAALLQSLFGYYDPFTGTTKYYMYADWLAKEDLNLNDPAIANKPKTVGGYDTYFNNARNFYETAQGVQVESVVEPNVDYLAGLEESDFYIDYNSWSIQANNQVLSQYSYERTGIPLNGVAGSVQYMTTRQYIMNNWGYNITYTINTHPIQKLDDNYQQIIDIRTTYIKTNGTGGGQYLYNNYALCFSIDDLTNNKAMVLNTNSDRDNHNFRFTFTSKSAESFQLPLCLIYYNRSISNGYNVCEDPVYITIFNDVQVESE